MNKVEQYEHRKITELSEEEVDTSIRKHNQPPQPIPHLSRKKTLIRDMHCKIKAKYRKVYPSLRTSEIKVLSAIILVQRLWRQRKVKEMIGEFLSPRSFSLSYGDTFGRLSQPTFFQQTNQDTMKTEKSLISLHEDNPIINIKINKRAYFFEDSNEQESSPSFKKEAESGRSSINLKDLEVSDELSEQSGESKVRDMIKYIDCYRDVTLSMKKEKNKKKNKPNAFNFPESLSEKCLLEKLYRKAFKRSPTKEAKV